jgi:hypothetical protein
MGLLKRAQVRIAVAAEQHGSGCVLSHLAAPLPHASVCVVIAPARKPSSAVGHSASITRYVPVRPCPERRCGTTIFTCGVYPSELTVNGGNAYTLGGCTLGTASYNPKNPAGSTPVKLDYPACLTQCVNSICPNNKGLRWGVAISQCHNTHVTCYAPVCSGCSFA